MRKKTIFISLIFTIILAVFSITYIIIKNNNKKLNNRESIQEENKENDDKELDDQLEASEDPIEENLKIDEVVPEKETSTPPNSSSNNNSNSNSSGSNSGNSNNSSNGNSNNSSNNNNSTSPPTVKPQEPPKPPTCNLSASNDFPTRDACVAKGNSLIYDINLNYGSYSCDSVLDCNDNIVGYHLTALDFDNKIDNSWRSR